MLTWMKVLWNRPARDASKRARVFVESNEECWVIDVLLRADEADRWVFAVFFQRSLPARPAPYKLLAVSKESSDIVELEAAEADRYRLRGHK